MERLSSLNCLANSHIRPLWQPSIFKTESERFELPSAFTPTLVFKTSFLPIRITLQIEKRQYRNSSLIYTTWYMSIIKQKNVICLYRLLYTTPARDFSQPGIGCDPILLNILKVIIIMFLFLYTRVILNV